MRIKTEAVNKLRVAPCVPAVAGHTTPRHSAVSGSVTATHSLIVLEGAAIRVKQSKNPFKSMKQVLFLELEKSW